MCFFSLCLIVSSFSKKGGRNEFHEFHESYLRIHFLIFRFTLEGPGQCD